ncbi:MAG: hypothetical protein JWM68_5848 [Verrucomicrobiales bacterium]|nr:hypothetical protein [Verrucomicrobiales bacterium]
MNASTLPRKSILVLVILSIATTVWVVRQRSIIETRRRLEQTRMQLASATNRVAAAESELDVLHQQSREEERTRDTTLAKVTEAQRQLTKVFPDARWAKPPEDLPVWLEESPYIWMQKDKLPGFPVEPFDSNGTIRDEVLTVFAADKKQRAALAASLPALLEEYRALELAKVKTLDEPLAGIDKDGPLKTVSIEPLPKEGALLKEKFNGKLREILGDQRAGLLDGLAKDWADQQFGQSGEPKTISLVRHPSGYYNLSVKSKNHWMSCGIAPGTEKIMLPNNIPPHILPMFADVIADAVVGGEGK